MIFIGLLMGKNDSNMVCIINQRIDILYTVYIQQQYTETRKNITWHVRLKYTPQDFLYMALSPKATKHMKRLIHIIQHSLLTIQFNI